MNRYTPMQLDIGCRNMAQSVCFYEKLGFKTVLLESLFVEITDGVLQIRLKRYSTPAMKLVYFTDNLDEKALFLDSQQVDYEWRKGKEEEIALIDPNGLKVSYSKRNSYSNPFQSPQPFSRIGGLKEVSIFTSCQEQTIDFWTKLKFDHTNVLDGYTHCTDGFYQIGIYKNNDILADTIGLTFSNQQGSLSIRELLSEGYQKIDQAKIAPFGIEGITKSPEGRTLLFTCEI